MNRKYMKPLPCAWCGSTDTWHKAFRHWDQDERGNELELEHADPAHSPKDEIWWCNDCDDGFIVELPDTDSMDTAR